MTVQILYTCKACGMVNEPIQVMVRQPDEDQVAWEGLVIAAIIIEHRKVRPNCTSEVIDEYLIPVPEGDKPVGSAETIN